jgi:HTH-type transcriptional regulator / antitoxin HigA
MENRVPAQVFPPGEYLKDELEARDMSQKELAEIMGRPLQAVNAILAGKKAITPDTALALAAALGTSAELWMNLESTYRLGLAAQKDKEEGQKVREVSRRAWLHGVAPVAEMKRRRWIKPCDSVAALETQLEAFFGQKLDKEPELPIAFKKADTYAVTNPNQRAWGFRARWLAQRVGAAKFDLAAFQQGLKELHTYLTHEADIRRIPRLLADVGVRFVVVEHLPKSRTDGATMWLDGGPVVAVSMRYDRIDNFWFTLCHELAHVLHGDAVSFDDDLAGPSLVVTDEKPAAERRADEWAANFLVPSAEIEKFILRTVPLYTKDAIMRFANRIRIHPGIIVGQLQRRKQIGYWYCREALVKVKAQLTASAMTDGWGATVEQGA